MYPTLSNCVNVVFKSDTEVFFNNTFQLFVVSVSSFFSIWYIHTLKYFHVQRKQFIRTVEFMFLPSCQIPRICQLPVLVHVFILNQFFNIPTPFTKCSFSVCINSPNALFSCLYKLLSVLQIKQCNKSMNDAHGGRNVLLLNVGTVLISVVLFVLLW